VAPAAAARRLTGVLLATWIVLAQAGVPLPAAAQDMANSETPEARAALTQCAFCRASLSVDEFCPRCGRLARIVATTSDHRFWGDVNYTPGFPPGDNPPKITADISPEGLVKEAVSFPSGDRFELRPGKKHIAVDGKVGSSARAKEDAYSGEVQDTIGEGGRLVTREVLGELQGDPDLYLYRRLDYSYGQDNRLEHVEFKTWYYRGSSDWKKRPSGWVRHKVGDIRMVRDAGKLTSIETTVREGKRSLRGDLEYGDPRVFKETVTWSGDKVDRVSPSHP
jgi:hypothetical protein